MLLEATSDNPEACGLIQSIEIFWWKRAEGACCRGIVTNYPLKLLSPFASMHFCNLCGQLIQASFALACNLAKFHSAVINSRAFFFTFFPAPQTSIHLGDRSDFSGPQISSIGYKSGEFAGQSTCLIPWIF